MRSMDGCGVTGDGRGGNVDRRFSAHAGCRQRSCTARDCFCWEVQSDCENMRHFSVFLRYCGLICSSGARPCDRIPSTCRRSGPCRSLCLCRSNRPRDRIPSTCHRTLRGRSSLCLCRSSSRPFRGCNLSPCDRGPRRSATRGAPCWARSRRRRRTACGWRSCRRGAAHPGIAASTASTARPPGRRQGAPREGCRAGFSAKRHAIGRPFSSFWSNSLIASC